MSSAQKIFLIILLFLLILLMLFACDARLKVQPYKISSEKLNGKVRMAFITDLHSCKYGKNASTLIAKIDEQNPDVILFGGDICDDDVPHDNTIALLNGIASRYPCYYVTGNHEYRSKEVDRVIQIFESYGVHVLNGTYDTVMINDQFINICGVTDPTVVKYTDSTFDIKKQLASLQNTHQNGYYTLLLAHRPELIETYMKYNFDLVLSGHAHGGQWRLPGVINGLFAPNQGLFPKYAGGKYHLNDTTFIVSRGLARESTLVPRIFNRPELVMIELDKEA